MANLGQRAKNRILSELQQGRFTLSDFSVNFEGNALVEIQFVAYPDFSLVISDAYSSRPLLPLGGQSGFKGPHTIETPGEAKTSEEHVFKDIHECIRRIPTWLRNIEAELSALNFSARSSAAEPDNEVVEVIEDLERQIQESASKQPMVPFSSEELTKLRRQLDQAVAKFEELEKENKVTKEQLEQAKKDIESMKDTASSYPKRVWYQVSGNRYLSMVKAVFTSKEGRAFLLEAARKYLLSGP